MLRTVALLGLFARAILADDCNSFGVDFTDGGNFFQNVLSTAPFGFVQEFSGACQQDMSQNLLVDPTGIQYQCSDTPLLPVMTPENSTW
jgi:hypothetical protein